MPVSYLICAAGRGLRTKVIHPSLPKPLLQINGWTLLEHAIRSLPLQTGDQVIVISQKQDGLSRLAHHLRQVFSEVAWQWLELEQYTLGQLHTAYLAMDFVPLENEIAIFNADSSFRSGHLLLEMRNSVWQGIIPCSIEDGDAWSFCQVANDENRAQAILAVSEKKRISKWCSVGFYFFRDALLFKKMAEEELAQPSAQEFYVSTLYNRYLQVGRPLLMLPIENFKAMGSVEQFSSYWGLSIAQMQAQNMNSLWEK